MYFTTPTPTPEPFGLSLPELCELASGYLLAAHERACQFARDVDGDRWQTVTLLSRAAVDAAVVAAEGATEAMSGEGGER